MHKTAVLLVNTGTPDEPTEPAVRSYLKEFLSDQRVVDLPRWQWLPILHGIILRKRPARSALRYQKIWTAKGSPILAIGELQRQKLQEQLDNKGHKATVLLAMRYGNPSIEDVLTTALENHDIEKIVVVPLFPQYASVVSGSILEEVMRVLSGRKFIPTVSLESSFCDVEGYTQALADSISSRWTWKPDGKHHLLFSFHSTLVEDIEAGDPYKEQLTATSRKVANLLDIPEDGYSIVFQDIFDKREWLRPLIGDRLQELSVQGIQNVATIAPIFVTDCLETLLDLGIEHKEEFESLSPENSFTYIPCLNSSPALIDVLTRVCERHL